MARFFRPKSYAMKVDPTLKYAWINIPKCASSFVQKSLSDNGWNDVPNDLIDTIASSPNVKKLVVLRDPVNPASNDDNKLAINNKISVQFSKYMLTNLHKKDYELFERYDRFTN